MANKNKANQNKQPAQDRGSVACFVRDPFFSTFFLRKLENNESLHNLRTVLLSRY